MMVEFVWCETLAWKRGHASNILAARSMFPKLDEPFLLVMSDHIFDQQLLHRLAHCQLAPGDALVLIDDSRTMVEWASPGGAHCQAHCKNGHCGAIVKVTKGAGDRVSLIAKKLTGFDAIDAGAYVVRPRELFDALKQLLTESIYCTLCEALNLMASQGRLRYATVDELDWFGSQTVASLPTPIYSSAVDPAWRQLALEMLRTTSPHLKALPALPTPGPEDAADASAASSSSTALSPLTPHGSFGRRLDLGGRGSSGDLSSDGVSSPELSMPLYELGSTIGSGGTSIVVQGRAGRSTGGPLGSQSPATSRRVQRGLAVKVIHKGAAEALGDVEEELLDDDDVVKQLNMIPASMAHIKPSHMPVIVTFRKLLFMVNATLSEPFPVDEGTTGPPQLEQQQQRSNELENQMNELRNAATGQGAEASNLQVRLPKPLTKH
jgi:hypothetical protein